MQLTRLDPRSHPVYRPQPLYIHHISSSQPRPESLLSVSLFIVLSPHALHSCCSASIESLLVFGAVVAGEQAMDKRSRDILPPDPSRVLVPALLATSSFLSLSAVRDGWLRGLGQQSGRSSSSSRVSAMGVASQALVYGTLACFGGCSGMAALFVAVTGITSPVKLLYELQKLDAYKTAKRESESTKDVQMLKGLFLPIGVASQRLLDRVGLKGALISAEEIEEWDKYIDDYERSIEQAGSNSDEDDDSDFEYSEEEEEDSNKTNKK